MNKDKPIFCTISGVSPDKICFGLDEKSTDCMALKFLLLSKIADLNSNGVTDFVCNCEMGISLWAAEIVLSLKKYNAVRLNVIMPFEEQASLWSNEWRERYFKIHEQADCVIILNKHFSDTCYSDCDRFMIDNSNMLLWIGRENSEIIEYSKEKQKQIISFATEIVKI